MSKKRTLKYKTIAKSEEAPVVGSVGRDKDTIFVKQISDTKADLYLSDSKGKILGLKKSGVTASSPIFIRHATPVYIQVGENHTIYLIISVESEVPFNIKSIRLIRGEEQDYDVPFDEFIEEIFPLKQKEVDIKGNKMVGFMVKKEDNHDFFNSIIESDSVEVTVTIDNVDKVLFSFLDISEKIFMAKIFRGMERNT